MNATLKEQYDKLSEIQQKINENKIGIKALKYKERRLRKEIERIEKIPEEVKEKLSDCYVKYIFDDDSCKFIGVEFIHMNELLSTEVTYDNKRLINKSATVINIKYDRDTKEIKSYMYEHDGTAIYNPTKIIYITKEEFESHLQLNKQFIAYGD